MLVNASNFRMSTQAQTMFAGVLEVILLESRQAIIMVKTESWEYGA